MTELHTPGPWETSRDAVPAGHVQITVYAPDGTRVATVFDRKANAPLIAAAPELLASLRELLDDNDVCEVIGDKWRRALLSLLNKAVTS